MHNILYILILILCLGSLPLHAQEDPFLAANRQKASEFLAHALKETASTTEKLKLLDRAMQLDPTNPALFASMKTLLKDRPSFYTRIYHMNLEVQAVAFSPDGQQVLTGGSDQQAILWGITGEKIRTFVGHTARVTSVAFSPDGQYVLTGSKDRSIKLWKSSGELVHTFLAHQKMVKDVAFSPDGQYILSGSDDGTAKLWRVDGQLLHTFPTAKTPSEAGAKVQSVAFSPDQQYLLVGAGSGDLILWSIKGRGLNIYKSLAGTVGATFSPDSRQIISVHQNSKLLIWNLDGSDSPINMYEDGEREEEGFFIGSMDEPETYDLHEKLATLPSQRVSRVHKRRILYQRGLQAMDLSPDGKFVIIGSDDGSSNIYDLAGRTQAILNSGFKRTPTSGSSVRAVAFSPEGKYALTGNIDYTAKLWPVMTANQDIELNIERGYRISSLDVSPDGQYLLMGSYDYGQAICWNMKAEEQFRLGYARRPTRISKALFSPSGTYILTNLGPQQARLWGKDSSVIATFTHPDAGIEQFAFSADEQAIVTVADDSSVKIWNLKGEIMGSLEGFSGQAFDVCISPDKQYILLGMQDSSAQLWQMNGSLQKVLRGHLGSVRKVAFSPDGQTLVTGSADGMIRFWNPRGQLKRVLVGHTNMITSLQFTPDGAHLLSTARGDATRLWNLRGQLEWIYAHPLGAKACGFLPGEKRVFLAKGASSFRTYILGQDQSYDFLPLSGFTQEEKQKFNLEK